MSRRRGILGAVALAVLVFGAAYADLVLRARSAYLEGEKYLEWSRRPELQRAYFDSVLETRRSELAAERRAGRLSQAEFDKKSALAVFERDQSVAESPLKYAYVWFKTAAEMMTPPESRWVVLSRARMGEARSLWQRELDAHKVPGRNAAFD